LRLCAHSSSGVEDVIGGVTDSIHLFFGEGGHKGILSSSMRSEPMSSREKANPDAS